MSSGLQKKLHQIEVTPPLGLWDKIASELDASTSYAQRLFEYQAQPPTETWAKVEAALEPTTVPAPVVPFFKRYKTPLRYIAAASFIAVTLVTATLLLRRTDADSLSNTSNITQPNTEIKTVTGESTGVAALTQTPKEPASRQSISQQAAIVTLKRTLASVRPQNIFPSLSISRKFIPREAAETALHFSSSDNFMVYSDGNGNAMKLPKKLFTLVSCPDGDGSCQERIHQLQQKLASSNVTADFMGMMDLVRQLQ